jgi:hypothetical protein
MVSMPEADLSISLSSAYSTRLGSLVIGDCLSVLSQLPDETLDLVVTSPPYDGQPKYGNGERDATPPPWPFWATNT